MRAARMLWAKLMRQFEPENEKSLSAWAGVTVTPSGVSQDSPSGAGPAGSIWTPPRSSVLRSGDPAAHT